MIIYGNKWQREQRLTLCISQISFCISIFSPIKPSESLFYIYSWESDSEQSNYSALELNKEKHKRVHPPPNNQYIIKMKDQLHNPHNLSKSSELSIIFKYIKLTKFFPYWRNSMFFMSFLLRTVSFAFQRSGIISILWICYFWAY